MDLSNIQIAFEYGNTEGKIRQEIIRNVQTILTTPLGTCPLYREFGVDMSFLDLPMNLAQNNFAVAAAEAVRRWEPRVYIKSVAFAADINGHLTAKVVIADG